MSTPALEISWLHAWYGESHILHGVDLTVHKGEVVTPLGRNGAGRTTTMRALWIDRAQGFHQNPRD